MSGHFHKDSSRLISAILQFLRKKFNHFQDETETAEKHATFPLHNTSVPSKQVLKANIWDSNVNSRQNPKFQQIQVLLSKTCEHQSCLIWLQICLTGDLSRHDIFTGLRNGNRYIQSLKSPEHIHVYSVLNIFDNLVPLNLHIFLTCFLFYNNYCWDKINSQTISKQRKDEN